MIEAWLVTNDGMNLSPVNAHFAEVLDGLPRRVPFRAQLTRPRSVVQNSFYWLCIGSMVKSGCGSKKDDIHDAGKMKCGLVRMARTPDGDFHAFPDSTAFDKLDQDGFNKYFDKAIDWWKASKLWDYIDPGMRAELENGRRS